MDAGFIIENILLKECNFSRVSNVTFDKSKTQPIAEIAVNCTVKENKALVQVTLKFENQVDEIKEVTASITMLGVFEKVGEMSLTLEEFGNVNGAAILYPYIREQLSSICLKAGLGNIILPPANFIKMYKDKIEKTL